MSNKRLKYILYLYLKKKYLRNPGNNKIRRFSRRTESTKLGIIADMVKFYIKRNLNPEKGGVKRDGSLASFN